MATLATLMTQSAPTPAGTTPIATIDRHPADGHGVGYVVLQLNTTGREVAWDGAAIRTLPRDWRERVRVELYCEETPQNTQ